MKLYSIEGETKVVLHAFIFEKEIAPKWREIEDVQAFSHFKVFPWGPKVKSQSVDHAIMCFVYLGTVILALRI